MCSVFITRFTKLLHLQTFYSSGRIFHCGVVSIIASSARQDNFFSHGDTNLIHL